MKVNVENLNNLVAQGLLTCREHDTEDLLIWNYTAKCQFDKYWLPETLNCRGLITRASGEIIERPFQKFFNIDDHIKTGGVIPGGSPIASEKMDGTLGILYQTASGLAIATRDGFNSDQAKKATEILRQKYPDFVPAAGYTFLFEIIYKDNRIIVDYGDKCDLYFIGAIDRKTGAQIPDENITGVPMPRVRSFGEMEPGELDKIEEKHSINKNNAEGVVLYWPKQNIRLKVKHSEYIEKIVKDAGISNVKIWRALKLATFNDLIVNCPEEVIEWVGDTAVDLNRKYDSTERWIDEAYGRLKDLVKINASAIAKKEYEQIYVLVMSKLNGKLLKEAIWDHIKPLEIETPFTEEKDINC